MNILDLIVKEVNHIESIDDISAFKKCVQNSYECLRSQFNQAHVDELVVARSDFCDALLCKVWSLLDLDKVDDLTLCAVGGYGRGQMQPYSDIDLLILSENAIPTDVKEKLSSFVTFLWDIKLEIGQSVRTIKETIKVAKDDITIATNLVEARRLIGNSDNLTKLQTKVNKDSVWSSKNFFIAKQKEQHNRHVKFNSTAYNLEPNIKENPGCLRDIQNIGWVAKKHYSAFDGMLLIKHGYFTQLEHAELIECRSNLWQIRFALHLIAGRNENRLLFDYQPEVAKLLGFGEDKTGVEKLMKHLFRVVRRVSELNSMLMLRFEQDILRVKINRCHNINEDFCIQDGLISPLNEKCFNTPLQILKFLELFAKHPNINGLDASCIHQLRNARRQFQSAYYYQIPECREYFIKLVSNPAFFDLGWDVMHQYGILQAYIPEWDKIVGMMQFDLFHAYTVDEHTHRLVKHIRRYYKNVQEFPRCSRIVNSSDKPHILFIAAIFHDIAKGRNGDHSILGEKDVYEFCDLHQIDGKDSELIAWLVRHHLLMSVTAQRRDIYDPVVVNEFANEVKSQYRLDFLYCLTLADIRATNNNLWNDWKAALLRELYLLTQKALENGLQCQKTFNERVKDHKASSLVLLKQRGIDSNKCNDFWSQIAPDYFVRFTPQQIAWHTECVIKKGKLAATDILVCASNHTSQAGTEFLIYCHDRPALFAQIASVVESTNGSIQDAQIMVTEENIVFDSMIVTSSDGERFKDNSQIKTLVNAIYRQLAKPGSNFENNRTLSRQMKQLKVPTKVRFYSPRQDSSLIELEALDVPGLLADVGKLFVDLNITLKMAKITTIGERAEDVFKVCNQQGLALTQDQQVLVRNKLIEKLDQAKTN